MDRAPLTDQGIAMAQAMAAQAIQSGHAVDAVIDACRYVVVPDVVLAELVANGLELTDEQLSWYAENPDGRRATYLWIRDDFVVDPDHLREGLIDHG